MSPVLILVVRCWYIKNSKNSFKQIINPFPGASILADHGALLKHMTVFLDV